MQIPDVELDSFVDQMRAEGQPQFTLRRRSEEETHYILKFIEPKATNTQALGLDLSFAPERIRALKQARDTGLPQMTSPVQLVQQDRTSPGFVVLMPIYTGGSATNNADGFKG